MNPLLLVKVIVLMALNRLIYLIEIGFVRNEPLILECFHNLEHLGKVPLLQICYYSLSDPLKHLAEQLV